MKFSSAASFDPNECNSKRATAGIIVGVLRRLFCSNGLPTYPSDHIAEKVSKQSEFDHQILNDKEIIIEVKPENPGLMARLMGLETMPVTKMAPDSITRSRSMSSVEHLQETDTMKRKKHRRVKSSVSIWEVPTFLEQENDEFFVLNFENRSRRRELRSKHRSKRRIEGQETRKKASIQRVNIDDQSKVSYSTGILRPTKNSSEKAIDIANQNEVFNAEKMTREMKNTSAVKKLCPDTGSEESSPVSVFDFEEFLFDLDVPTSADEDSQSRRKLTLEPENHEQPSSNSTDGTTPIDEKESKKTDTQNKNNIIKWKQINKLAERDVNEADWRYRDMELVEDIQKGFEIQILHQLLNELVNQLV